jgi:hypothetical protein
VKDFNRDSVQTMQVFKQVFPKYRAFQKGLYNCNPTVTVRRLLRKCLHLKAYKLSIAEDVERGIFERL